MVNNMREQRKKGYTLKEIIYDVQCICISEVLYMKPALARCPVLTSVRILDSWKVKCSEIVEIALDPEIESLPIPGGIYLFCLKGSGHNWRLAYDSGMAHISHDGVIFSTFTDMGQVPVKRLRETLNKMRFREYATKSDQTITRIIVQQSRLIQGVIEKVLNKHKMRLVTVSSYNNKAIRPDPVPDVSEYSYPSCTELVMLDERDQVLERCSVIACNHNNMLFSLNLTRALGPWSIIWRSNPYKWG